MRKAVETGGDRRSFTLIELLVVIAIISVAVVGVVYALNPAQMLKQSRDSTRIADMDTLNKAMALIDSQALLSSSFGSLYTVYISIPDPTATSSAGTACAGITGLPSLPYGWAYHCPQAVSARNIDGTGWVPVNFKTLTTGIPFSQLPTDPRNTTAQGPFYYTYVFQKDWSFTARMESQKYLASAAISDSGYDPDRVEAGTNLALWKIPSRLAGHWSFDEGMGAVANDTEKTTPMALKEYVFEEFENGTTTGWAFDCGGMPTSTITSDAFMGKGALRIQATGGDGFVCALRTITNPTPGQNIVFAAKGNGGMSICVYNGSACTNGTVTLVGSFPNGWALYKAGITTTTPSSVYIYSNGIGNYMQYDSLSVAPVWIPGKLGSALSFNGGTDYLTQQNSANNPDFDFAANQDFTLSFWVKTNTILDTSTAFMGKFFSGGGPGWGVRGTGSANTIEFWSAPDTTVFCTTCNYHDGQWHLVTVMRSVGTKYIYFDGAFAASIGTTSSDLTNASLPLIGRRSTTMTGYLDDVRIYRRALTAAEVKSLYDAAP